MQIKLIPKILISIFLIGILALLLSCNSPMVSIPQGTELGKEYPDPNEEKIAKRILDLTLKSVESNQESNGNTLRDAHPKSHGCVAGTFAVENSIPGSMKFGIFAKPKSYPIWIRFSNGSAKPKADKEGDIRGMAIKLMNVEGTKLLEDEKNEKTQDFLLISNPILPVGDPQEYLELFEAAFENRLTSYIFLGGRFGALKRVNAIRKLQVPSPLAIRYWSTTPFKLGGLAVKYSAKPCSDVQTTMPNTESPNYLRERMVQDLSEKSSCFDFMVQPQTDPIEMPVEEPAKEWNEKESPFVKVGTIQIQKQIFDTKEQNEFCENISFTPWHSLPDHRPLGGINRVRKSVYIGISKFRHEKNKIPRKEPTPKK